MRRRRSNFGSRVLFSAGFCALVGPILGCLVISLDEVVQNGNWSRILSVGINPLSWLLAISAAGPFGLIVGAAGALIVLPLASKVSGWRLLEDAVATGIVLGALFPLEFIIRDRQWNFGDWVLAGYGAAVGLLCAASLSLLYYGIPRTAKPSRLESHA